MLTVIFFMVKNSRGIAYVLSVQYIIRSTMDGARTKSPSPMCMCTCNTIGDNSLEVTITLILLKWIAQNDRSLSPCGYCPSCDTYEEIHPFMDRCIDLTDTTDMSFVSEQQSSIHITSIWVTINPTQYQSTFW